MANDFKNTALVTKFAVKAFLNNLMLGQKVDRQLDEKKIFSGKIGTTTDIRRPVMFTTESGATITTLNDIEEAKVAFSLDQREKVAFKVTSEDLGLKIEDANETYIIPAMEELAQKVETHIASKYTEIPNFVGTPGTTPSTFLDIANAGAELSKLGVPLANRSAFWDSGSTVSLANGLKGVFVQKAAKTAIEQASLGRYANFDNFENNSLSNHTVGVNTGTPLVNGASQNVTYLASKDTDTQSLITDGWTASQTGILKAGDVITLAGVNSVNRRTRADTGDLMTFTVTADVNSDGSGNATPTIAPAMITSGPYQTVTAAPADNAVITVKTGTGAAVHRQNIAFHKNAITLGFGQLDVITDGATGFRQNFKGISLKAQRQYDVTNDDLTFRFDILFGVKVQNRNWAVRITK